MALLTPVAAPEIQPSPYGLFSLDAEMNPPGNEQWLSGLAVETRACGMKLHVKDICDNSLDSEVFTPSTNEETVCAYPAMPVSVQVDMPERSTFGMLAQNYELWTEEALLVGSQKGLEHELWTGGLAAAAGYDNRFLASGAAVTDITPTPGTPVKIRYGLALLEGALGDCGLGAPGVIHMRREVASPLGLKADDGQLKTNLGNLVVAGAGYPGTGPDGTAPATGTWIYATGPVFWWLGDATIYPDNISQAVLISRNSVQWLGERPAAVAFDGCCIFAVHVDLQLDYM